jgi:type IV pilus assembly protein PilY1
MTMHTTNKKSALTATTALGLWLIAATNSGLAAPLSLSNVPLFITSGVEANVLLTFDDSGSMSWAFLPDGISGSTYRDGPRGCASNVNRIYYNPAVKYKPALNKDGAALNTTETSFTAAYHNGYLTSAGIVDLSTGYRPKWVTNSAGNSISTYATCGQTTPTAAFYFVYDTSLAGVGGCPNPAVDTNNNCYRRVTVSSTSGPGGTDERQNFANWYSYYSTRNLLAKSAAGQAFAAIGKNIRVAGQHLNNTSGSSPSRFTDDIGLMRKFCDDPTGTDPNCPDGSNARSDFFTRLYNSPASGWTPLRAALRRAGDYFGSGNSGADSPYRDTPGSSTSPERSCRQNFHVLFTDGYWNSTAGLTGNYDGNTQTLGDNVEYAGALTGITTYTPRAPYQDSWPTASGGESTLADNAFYYWFNDLRPDLDNNVPTYWPDESGSTIDAKVWNRRNDPARWQHLVNFTIGLGIDGTLAHNDATYAALDAGTASWPDPFADTTGARVDDLWHAAINSRGRYFSARDPGELTSAFSEVLRNIERRSGSYAAVATSSYFVSTGTTLSIYQVSFNSGGWYGGLSKYTGTLVRDLAGYLSLTITGPDWNAADRVDTQSADPFGQRRIITYKPTTSQGVPFTWSNLSDVQQDALSDDPDTVTVENRTTAAAAGQARLAYLRGESSQEGNVSGYNFRVRGTTKLGDIVSSEPLYVGASIFKYADSLSGSPNHSTYRTAVQSRPPIVYVGANDGMLHAFDAATGTEQLAYVPGAVYRNLNRLTSRNYSHLFYADGSPVHADVYFGGGWKTILAGGLNAGGQGIYALNITDPSQFNEGNASSLVLWEFTDRNDADLGYTFGKPVIARVRIAAGTYTWAVIFGNGYNNTDADGTPSLTGEAYLYIVRADNGNLIAKLPTRTGSLTTPNGLTTPSIVDYDGDRVVDYVYAGDLLGNMWKFDLRDNDPGKWASAYGTGSTPRPLFRAVDASNNPQPITIPPQVTYHPLGTGYLVMFGTGKYIENGDHTTVGAQTQTVYGIWDKDVNGTGTPVARGDLLQQSIINTATAAGVEYRNVTNNAISWRISGTSGHLGWRLDLTDPGERQVTELDLKGGHLIFTTLVPSSDPCEFGGHGWQMELNYENGGRLDASPFDVNQDGYVCECAADNVNFPGYNNTPPAGRKGSPTRRRIVHGQDVDHKIENPPDGSKPGSYLESSGDTKRGRSSWRQL